MNELTAAIPAAISCAEFIEGTIDQHLPTGDNLSTTLSSPQFSQALSMFWSALLSGQAGPVVQQFGVSTEVIKAAAIGSIEQFVKALESEVKTSSDTNQEDAAEKVELQQQTRTKKHSESNTNKKDDNDDEGMALD